MPPAYCLALLTALACRKEDFALLVSKFYLSPRYEHDTLRRILDDFHLLSPEGSVPKKEISSVQRRARIELLFASRQLPPVYLLSAF